MRVLVTWGSKMGGTQGIAQILGEHLRNAGHEVTLMPAAKAPRVGDFEAVIIGGALYANRWHADARRFVARQVAELRRVPVWMFSSGPLDDSAAQRSIPPTNQVAVLMEQVGALGHVTFGGHLAPDAKGFPARAMAKEHSGDWRDPDRIRAWADELALALPSARPGVAIDHPAHSLLRLLSHGVIGWALGAAVLSVLLRFFALGTTAALHAIALTLIFVAVSQHYFRARGARAPLPAALGFALLVGVLNLALEGLRSSAAFGILDSVTMFWLPLALVFVVSWATGAMLSTLPWPKPNVSQPH